MSALLSASFPKAALCSSCSGVAGQRRSALANCRSQPQSRGARQQGGRDLPPPPPEPEQQQAVDRRGLLALLAAASVTLPATQANAAAAQGAAVATDGAGSQAAGAASPAPADLLPVPPLTETFISSEGFRFDYPAGWVVAFDRSGSSGNGAVIVVGDFRALITVAVFRTTTIAEEIKRAGLNVETGYSICIDPPMRESSTVRFNVLRSAMAPPPPGGTGEAEPTAAAAAAYDFEFSVESCVGEIEEGIGGKLRCLGPFGNSIPTSRRRHTGRCVLVNGVAYSLNGSSPEERWDQVGPVLQAVVNTFRA